ncbi:MAG TPA: alpha-amylase family glycosyl hydrolase, partial [Candidatus Thermoplasmatota archaeon]|nr:alpha-amylase family glycosyl hydrolase [Candidatus Thermoplasmatota archaeon]
MRAATAEALEDLVIYEAHVGTATPQGTFDALARRLPELAELGVTALEVMPVAQFPGGRNWGYDGVFPFAAQDTYGGPHGFQRLVDAAHRHGLAVVLDVVYNHLGPQGNVLGRFAPYFTDRYRTPWGDALDFDGGASDGVRRYFLENVRYWLEDLHVDALRLDAVHAILDQSARPFLQELAETVQDVRRRTGRQAWAIAESDRNDPRLVRPPEAGGLGLDAAWSDDLHHALHAVLTAEAHGYYADFGQVRHLARALAHGYVYQGERSPYRGHRHGAPPTGVEAKRFVVAAQNHDQVGNRMLGDRLAASLPEGALHAAAATVLL